MTKKIICLVLVFFALMSLFSCAKKPDDKENDGSQGTETVLRGVLRAGYGIADITPDLPIELNTNELLTRVEEPIYATCIALNDGENTVLLFSLDIKSIPDGQDKTLRELVSRRTGVPAENILLHATHNHSAPTPGVPSTSSAIVKWTSLFRSQAIEAAVAAIADLSSAKMLSGVAKTTNYAFVRRYIHEDGSFSGIHVKNVSQTKIVAHETEADDTVQIVRFVRDGKKDILIANWQAHAAHAIIKYGDAVAGDIPYHFRKRIEEKDDDLLAALFFGASGNINLTPKIQSRNMCNADYVKVGTFLAATVYDQLEELSEMKTDRISVLSSYCVAPYRDVSSEEVERAELVLAAGEPGSAEYEEALVKYGFNSRYEVSTVISLSERQGKNGEIMLRTIAVGDLAFAAVPYEMFDTNGMEVKTGSPYKMTFILATTNGSQGYMPSAIAVPNGGYEVYTSSYKYGTAEKVVGKLLEMLNEMKNTTHGQ